MASILEGCTYINGSPQNTFVPGVIELAVQHGVFIAGDDFKSGQTKLKSVLVDFLISSGIKVSDDSGMGHALGLAGYSVRLGNTWPPTSGGIPASNNPSPPSLW